MRSTRSWGSPASARPRRRGSCGTTAPGCTDSARGPPTLMRRRRRLARKYAIVLVALVTGVLLASGAVEIYTSYEENKAALVALQREKAAGAASRIESF